MTANVSATNYPDVLQARLFQSGTGKPGTALLKTAYSTANVPSTTTLTMSARSLAFNGQWNNMKLVKRPRALRDEIQWVLQDERWKLGEIFFSQNYNARDDLGRIETNSQKTIPQLWSEIANAWGVTINIASSPAFLPPAPWSGKNGIEVVNQLLRDTMSVMNYNPETQIWVVSSCGTGFLPDLSQRTYQQEPVNQIANVHADSAPIQFESDLDAQAVLVDGSGNITPLGGLVTPIDFFEGFSGEAADDRARYQQSAFRLWEITQASYPEILTPDKFVLTGKRATALAPGAEFVLTTEAVPATQGASLVAIPNFQFHSYAGGNQIGGGDLTLLDDSVIFYSDRPILSVVSGALNEDIKIHAAFQVRDANGTFRRLRQTRNVSGSGDDVTEIIPWIKPVDSDLADKNAGTSQWATTLGQVADALNTRYAVARQTAQVATLANANATGQLGAVLYEASTGFRGETRTTWAFNFIPKDWVDLRW